MTSRTRTPEQCLTARSGPSRRDLFRIRVWRRPNIEVDLETNHRDKLH